MYTEPLFDPLSSSAVLEVEVCKPKPSQESPQTQHSTRPRNRKEPARPPAAVSATPAPLTIYYLAAAVAAGDLPPPGEAPSVSAVLRILILRRVQITEANGAILAISSICQ